jgi:hypothetical protein
MVNARLAFVAAAAGAALAILLPIAMRPGLSFAQQQNQDSQDQQMQAPGTMQEPESMPGSAPESMANGHGFGHVEIQQMPSITMTAVPGYGSAPLTVGFFVNTVDPEGKGFVSYLWNFGDGQVSMDPPLTFFHTYSVAGTYVATVNATTPDGRTATAYVGITVRPSVLD